MEFGDESVADGPLWLFRKMIKVQSTGDRHLFTHLFTADFHWNMDFTQKLKNSAVRSAKTSGLKFHNKSLLRKLRSNLFDQQAWTW